MLVYVQSWEKRGLACRDVGDAQMRKHALSGMLLAAALGLSLHAGAGQVLAEDGAELFPPEMLQPAAPKAPVPAPAPAGLAAAESAPAAASSAAGTPVPVVVATSVPLAPVARAPIAFEAAAPQKIVAARKRAEARVVAHRRHVRHIQHARLVPAVLPPVRAVFAPPLPAVRIAQSSCSGFCGKYVLVGVGF